jgi:ankyrin repeat protein
MRFKNIYEQTYNRINDGSVFHKPTEEEMRIRNKIRYADADIFTASKRGAYDRVKKLLDSGVDTDVVYNNDKTPLMFASYY